MVILLSKKQQNAAGAKEQVWNEKSSTICECSGNFLNIMVSDDTFVKEALNFGIAREEVSKRKSFTIFEWNGNLLNIMVNGDPVVKEVLTVGVARKQAWTSLLPFV